MSEGQQSSNEPESFFEADFGPNIGVRRFFTPEDLGTFAEAMRDAFAWVPATKGATPSQQNVINLIRKSTDQLSVHVEALKTAVKSNNEAELARAKLALTQIIQVIAQRRILAHDDARVYAMQKLVRDDPKVAISMLGYFMGHLSTITEANEVAGIVYSVAYQLGLHEFEPATKATSDALLTEFRTRLSDVSSQLATARNLSESIRDEHTAATAARTKAFDDDQTARSEAFKAQRRIGQKSGCV